jgi:hypothetical protein
MTANVIQKESEQKIDIALNPSKKMEWVVRDNAELQAELNRPPKRGEKISPKVVNKVLDCIKDL